MHYKAFGCSPGFEELAQIDLDHLETFGLELCGQFPADLVEDDCVFAVDGVAGEVDSVGFGDDDAFGGWIEGFDCGDGSGVKGFGIVQDVAVG